MKKSRILTEVNQTARGLNRIGVLDQQTMREFDVLTVPPVRALSARQIRAIRARTRMSQAVFAAGVAMLTGVHARLAAVLLTAMFACFTPLVHVPMLLADPSSHWNWAENALNLAVIGAAWVVADSLARARG